MAESIGGGTRPTDPVGRVLYSISKAFAIFGGALTCVMAVVVTASVVGRRFFATPIPDDNDLVAIMCGCAVFSFLPYCHLMRGNIVVDFFTASSPPRVKASLDSAGNIFYLAAAVMLTWRTFYGMYDLYIHSEKLAFVTFYRWWTLPFDIACLFLLVAVIVYVLAHDLGDVRARREPPPQTIVD